MGELVQCKKRKINDSINEYTTPRPSKAIFEKEISKIMPKAAVVTRVTMADVAQKSQKKLREKF